MKKLKLSELNLSEAAVLTREELKKVLGGDGSGGGGGTTCLVCATPGRVGCRYRQDPTGDPTEACCEIYPAYCGQLTGNWGECTAGCTMN